MKWIQHDTQARNDVKIKLLKSTFGAEGYGVYFQLLEIIGENIGKDNPEEWGFVSKHHTLKTLADECGVTEKKLKKILEFCNSLELFQKFRGKLYNHQILSRLDTYASRLAKSIDLDKRKQELCEETSNNVQTDFEQTSLRKEKNRIEERKEEENTTQKQTDFVQQYLDFWNQTYKTSFSSGDAIEKNLEFWMKSYTFDQIKQAIEMIRHHHFWHDKMKPVTLLRRKNVNKEDVDYIGELINYKPTKKFDNEATGDKYADM